MTSSADSEPGDGGHDHQDVLGRAPAPGEALEVVDFDLLDAPAAASAPQVVDFGDLDRPRSGRGQVAEPAHTSIAGPADVGSGEADVLDGPITATAVEVVELDEMPVVAAPAVVVDVEAAGRALDRPEDSRSSSGRSSGRRSRAAGGRSSSGDGGSRSFGDGGSRSFGGRSRGAGSRRSGGGRARGAWGIQLDAEVEEPAPAPTPGELPAAAEEPQAATEAGRRPRAGGRGRAGSFGRPRRAEGEPAPEYEDPEQAAKQICLTALTGASRTRQQLADLLAARDIPADVAESVLERFTEVGLVDDAAFAAAWVSSRQSARGLSRRALADELRRKGVDKEVAEVALEAVDPQDEWETARALVARKVPGMRRLDHATATRRLTALLGRKGYGPGLSSWVVREALEADGKAEDAAAEADDAPPDLAGARGSTRRGLWSGRPLDDEAAGQPAVVDEVGEGLGAEGWARTRRPGRSG
ncbi:RecX family protein [Klenkia marina]|uniref:Regulatory protein RecX n=1 Tax=Klenkia marina TaxID=1960309 RepID=A0A1G4Z2V3_9ACTN|nr:regulatory protein RecX [Klenkia marina]SCX59925.1 RecX family protein [Klenkia marina]